MGRTRSVRRVLMVLAPAATVVACAGSGPEPPQEPRRSTAPSRPAAALEGYGFPNRETTGVPAGWEPAETRDDHLIVTTDGEIVEDVRLTGGASIVVKADDVTIRRVELQGGSIVNDEGVGDQADVAAGVCGNDLVVEDTSFVPEAGLPYAENDLPRIMAGGYTARRVEVWKAAEGFRASICGPVTIEDSFAHIEGDTPDCGRDRHSDGVQGYYARGLTIRNSTIVFGNDCGTSPYYIGYGPGYPSEPPINTGRYTVDRLLVAGGGYVFRQNVPASVTGLRIVDRSWVYGPIDSACPDISPWEAKIVRVDASYRITRVVRDQRCDTATKG